MEVGKHEASQSTGIVEMRMKVSAADQLNQGGCRAMLQKCKWDILVMELIFSQNVTSGSKGYKYCGSVSVYGWTGRNQTRRGQSHPT